MGDAARAGDEKVAHLPTGRGRQLTLIAGGATVDTAVIGGVSFAAGTKELDAQFKKGDDVRIEVVARVTGVNCVDKYDAHGNIAETIRKHGLRVDEVRSVGLERAQAAVTAAEAQAEDDAREDGDEPVREPEPAFEADDGDDPNVDPDAEPEPDDGDDDGEPGDEPEPGDDDGGEFDED